LGPELEALEQEVAACCRVRHAVGVASGSDALRLALVALGVGPGDEVLTSAFSFIASGTAVLQAGARPVFVDVEPDTLNLDPRVVEAALTPRTRAIVAVHLFGLPAAMDPLAGLAASRGLLLVEDAAQAFGAEYAGRPVGGFGDAAALSFYPTKGLGAYGDAGMVLTRHPETAQRLRRLRNHGAAEKYDHVELGWNSRLDELQAAILRVKLRHVRGWVEARRRLAGAYGSRLAGLPLALPGDRPPARHVFHQYTVRTPRRDELAKHLAASGIGTACHYPQPIPAQTALRALGYRPEGCPEAWAASREVLSLPCFPELTAEEVETVARAIHTFFAQGAI
ncbi:MAG: DegT/DnrJ/EryC1/StrS family aminotransferase, partial [Candidatus Rokubacteria bacterium]|nr:DegT/DnrJ/EryC1/StrS family aminotransferase [Candidatus Rokubacteria bacterium]